MMGLRRAVVILLLGLASQVSGKSSAVDPTVEELRVAYSEWVKSLCLSGHYESRLMIESPEGDRLISRQVNRTSGLIAKRKALWRVSCRTDMPPQISVAASKGNMGTVRGLATDSTCNDLFSMQYFPDEGFTVAALDSRYSSPEVINPTFHSWCSECQSTINPLGGAVYSAKEGSYLLPGEKEVTPQKWELLSRVDSKSELQLTGQTHTIIYTFRTELDTPLLERVELFTDGSSGDRKSSRIVTLSDYVESEDGAKIATLLTDRSAQLVTSSTGVTEPRQQVLTWKLHINRQNPAEDSDFEFEFSPNTSFVGFWKAPSYGKKWSLLGLKNEKVD